MRVFFKKMAIEFCSSCKFVNFAMIGSCIQNLPVGFVQVGVQPLRTQEISSFLVMAVKCVYKLLFEV